ncbi:class D beta-lactamase [Pseudomonas sp. N040]|uniref:class D beta-lactamase n=1 Tax=Pseudomonas sp. N040 TaxID=2785325 RepID=UPI0018A2F6AA|nr:class D beta-lactamase [Pseudomonas sp. N040]MBF7731086.1 class D beta-lactamase [Pseudomonas sp. N040]MBW7014729.1 class D beta-lactamase [Pseudomonas sp. N040]
MPRLVTFVFCLLLCPALLAEDAQIARLLADSGVQGTLVLSSLKGGQTFIHDDARAARRFSAASTFKIPNTLIALQLGVVAGKDSPFHWDGTHYGIANWNQDQTLETAFRVSCVWCYQQLAGKIGQAAYRDWLRRIGYGVLHEPFTLTRFWLDGALQISALEQVAFLKQVYQRRLPFRPAAYDSLQQIMLSEQTGAYRLFAKTGLAGDSPPQVGWYVGYVETAEDVWFFASNLDIHDARQLPLRLALTRAALQAKGVFNAGKDLTGEQP